MSLKKPDGYPTGGPGEITCRSPDADYVSASALRTLADRLRGSDTVWCASNNGTQEGDRGWTRVVCEKKSLASIWIQTWVCQRIQNSFFVLDNGETPDADI